MSAAAGPSGGAGSGAPRATIHDLGYRRYLGTRRSQATRWQVIVRNQVATSWRGFWRMKAWVIGATMTTVVLGILMFVLRHQAFGELARRATGSPLTFVDGLLPMAMFYLPWFGFVIGISIGATVVARDLQAGAFEFYFARPVRPIDYVLGKFVGLFLIVATVVVAPPLVLSLYRVGLASPDDMLPALAGVPKMLLVSVLTAACYAALPMACGAFGKPRHAIAVWTGGYMLVGNVLAGVALNFERPALAVLNPPNAAATLAFDLFDVAPAVRGMVAHEQVAPGWAGGLALAGYAALGIAITWWRVTRAERAGLGGG